MSAVRARAARSYARPRRALVNEARTPWRMERVHLVTSHVQTGGASGEDGGGTFDIVDGDFDGIPVRQDLLLYSLTRNIAFARRFFQGTAPNSAARTTELTAVGG